MADFRMPSLGADMESGILIEWLVKPGNRVKRGDIVATVQTDKGLFEVEIFMDGVIERLLVEPDTKVPVGEVLATIRSEGRPPAEKEAIRPEGVAAVQTPAAAVPQPAPLLVPPAGERVPASPSARKLAADLGVDLATLRGTGPRGAIQRADVEQAAAERKSSPPADSPSPPVAVKPEVGLQAGMRRAIAAAMSRSNRDIPHYYLETAIDMTASLRWLEAENMRRPIRERLLPTVLLLKAVARALREVPELNGYWLDDRLQPQEAVHIGFAISLRSGGLITPAIHDADTLNLDQLMAAMGDLISRTRAGRLRSSEMTDSTITLTNLGDLGVETVFGVIYPPQVALVGLGRISERPWAENGMLGVRRAVSASLAADHRATDGHRGSQFLAALNHQLQGPEKL